MVYSMDLESIAKHYKAVSQELDFFVALASKTGVIVNNEAIRNSPVADGTLKQIISYYTALGLLMGYSHLLNYQRKMLKSLVKSKDKEFDGMDNTLFDVVTQTKVLAASLEGLSKTYRHRLSSVGDAQTLHDIWKILDKSATDIEKRHIVSLQNDIKGLLKGQEVTGGYDGRLRSITQKFQGGAEDNFHEVIVGGFDKEAPEMALVSGFQSAALLRRKNIQQHLLQEDLSTIKPESADEYYSKVFIPRVAEMVGAAESDVLSELDKKLKAPADTYRKEMRLGLSDRLHNQYNAILQGLPHLLEYYQSRLKHNLSVLQLHAQNDQLELEYKDELLELQGTWRWDPQHPEDSTTKLVELISLIFNAVHAADVKKVVRFAKDEFANLNALEEDQVENLYKELEELLTQISEAQINIRERHTSKEKIQEKTNSLLNLLKKTPESVKMLQVPPKIDAEKLQKKPAEAKIRAILKCTDYLLRKESDLLPVLQKDEEYYDLVASELGDLFKMIMHMFSPENKFTCIRKCSTAIITAMRAEVLKHLVEKRFKEHADLIPKLEAIRNRLLALMSIDAVEFYRNGKLQLDEIKKIAAAKC